MKVFCDKSKSINVELLCDHVGNIYIKFNGLYYYVYIDSDKVEFVMLKNIDIFKNNLIENKNTLDIKYGKIKPSPGTLRGKVIGTLNDLPEDEKYEVDFSSYDYTFDERGYYTIIRNTEQEDNEDNDDNNDNNDIDCSYEIFPFDINGIDETKEIQIADIMMTSPCTHDTIIIQGDHESNNVISTIERKDGYCVRRLTVYTDGYLKINNVGDSITYFKLKMLDDKLCAQIMLKGA